MTQPRKKPTPARPRMKRASYREGVAWIASNDEEGSEDALRDIVVRSYVSTVLLADLFGLEPERVARDVVRLRMKTLRQARKP